MSIPSCGNTNQRDRSGAVGCEIGLRQSGRVVCVAPTWAFPSWGRFHKFSSKVCLDFWGLRFWNRQWWALKHVRIPKPPLLRLCHPWKYCQLIQPSGCLVRIVGRLSFLNEVLYLAVQQIVWPCDPMKCLIYYVIYYFEACHHEVSHGRASPNVHGKSSKKKMRYWMNRTVR